MIAPGETRLGWIGTGVMGGPMCGHLIARGFAVTVHTRTRAKAEPLLASGATWAARPRDVTAASDVVFTMLGFPAEVRSVLLGEGGALTMARPGEVFVDMSTGAPALARELDAAARGRGAHSVDAPVSGGDIGAREARLSIMIGGEPEVIEALRPAWEAMGRTIVRHGGAGAGQHAKMANQVLVATTMIGVCESLLYGFRAGLDFSAMLESIASGAAGSWSFSNLGPRIIAGDFEPGFFVDHFVKDLGIALDEAKQMGLVLPGLALAEQLYRAVQSGGWGRKGTHALELALARLSGIEWPVSTRGARPV